MIGIAKKALITGASRGIGKSIKRLFEERNILVYAPTRAEMDLTDNASIKNYISNLDSEIDIVVNNAGINEIALLENITEENWSDTLQVNLRAGFEIIKAVVPQMKKRKYGRIVNISSIWSEVSKPGRITYSVAKTAVNGMTRSMAIELASYNVLVNAVAPGFVNTDLTKQNNSYEEIVKMADLLPLKRLAEPEEIAEVVYFLCSEKNSFIVGQTIIADGGFTCL